MGMLKFKTTSLKPADAVGKWYIVDAENETLGRMCSKIATVLRGKHRPDFTPHVDAGDQVIVLNAGKVRLTGNKWNAKNYITFSGYPGGQKVKSATEVRAKNPIYLIEHGVRGMLPKTRLGRSMFHKLHVYEGAEHPHAGQKPEKLEI